MAAAISSTFALDRWHFLFKVYLDLLVKRSSCSSEQQHLEYVSSVLRQPSHFAIQNTLRSVKSNLNILTTAP